MPIQLPNDAVSVGYKETKPYHHEQVFQSESAGFTGTEREFVEAGHGYEYVQTTPHIRHMAGASLARVENEESHAATLPEMCFIFMEDAEPGEYVRAVRRGESGCFATTYGESDPDKARALVAHMNRKLRVSELQAECMLAGSMFGWDTPGADPDRLEKAKRNSEKGTAMNDQRERVYDLPNGHLNSAEHMFKWLQHEGFTPAWDSGVRDGEYRYGITLPVDEVPQLRELQKANPARWGNHPDVSAALKAAEQQAKRDAEVNRQRFDRLNPEQQEWIEKIHYETGLYIGQALDLNDKLHDLASKHLKLCLIDVEEGLSGEQEAARDAIESQVREICGGIKGIKEVQFGFQPLGDNPGGTTLTVVFESGAYNNTFSNGWKVPVDPKYLNALDAKALGIPSSAKEHCWALVSRIIEKDGPGTPEQIEYDELAATYGERPDDPVWLEFGRSLEERDDLGSSPRP